MHVAVRRCPALASCHAVLSCGSCGDSSAAQEVYVQALPSTGNAAVLSLVLLAPMFSHQHDTWVSLKGAAIYPPLIRECEVLESGDISCMLSCSQPHLGPASFSDWPPALCALPREGVHAAAAKCRVGFLRTAAAAVVVS